MHSNDIYTLIAFIVYICCMTAIGLIYYRRTFNLSDYILGGRKLNTWVTSMSAQASDMSGWLLLGLPGFAYVAGMEAFWLVLGLWVGTYLNWKVVARRLREYTERLNDSLTLPDYFENRFNDKSKVLRIISAVFILVFFGIYVSSGFVAGAKLFSTVFDFSYMTALIVGVSVIIIYTFLGGFMAVSWTDFFQGSLMFIAIIAVPVFGFKLTGGVSGAVQQIRNINPELLNIFTDSSGAKLGAIAIISNLAWGLGYYGQPHILARFMAINSPDNIPRARHIAMTWVTFSLIFAVVVGMLGLAGLQQSLEGPDSEKVFMILIDVLFHPLIAGIFLSAVLAAIMSTADSQLLVASSALTEDLYKVLLRRHASQTELVWISRCAVIMIAIIAFLIATDPASSVLNLVAYAWAGFGATFGPLIIMSLYWKGMTRTGALGGMIVGGVTVIIWKNLSGGLFDMYEMAPGFVLSFLAIYLFSKLTTVKAHVSSF